MRTIRTLTEKDDKPPCPECKGKRSHKLDCSVASRAAGIPPMTWYELKEAKAKEGPVHLCDRCNDERKGLYVFKGLLLCNLCWAFKRTREGSPLAPEPILTPEYSLITLKMMHASLSRGVKTYDKATVYVDGVKMQDFDGRIQL